MKETNDNAIFSIAFEVNGETFIREVSEHVDIYEDHIFLKIVKNKK